MQRTMWLLFASAFVSTPSIAQSAHQHGTHAATPQDAVQLGEIDFPNSGKPEAQADFLRGVKLLHNFQYEDAIDAFQAAEKSDPEFALAYWGEAMSHNYTLWAEQHYDEARAALAKFAPTPAERAAKVKTARERAYLAAVEALYGPGTKFDRDVAYADRMDALAKAYPDDIDAQAFDALATLGRTHGTRGPNYAKAGAMLEPLFARYPSHPGIVHYLIHSYDDPAHAARGLAAARAYDKLAPDSVHAQHMTSHIFLSLGMWPDVERANVQARQTLERRAGKPVPMAACGHGAIWLVYARLQQGLPVAQQIAECRAAATALIGSDDATISVVGSPEGAAGSVADMVVRKGIETNNWEQPLALPDGRLTFARYLFAYGDLLASRADPAGATNALDRMRAAHGVLAANYPKENPDDDQTMAWMDLMLAQAEALTALINHQETGLEAMAEVAKRESALPSAFGPPILLKPTWELLGDERLKAGDKSGAAAAYRESLKLQPGRRLSIEGLAKASQ